MSAPITTGVAGLTFQGNDFEWSPRAGHNLGYGFKGPFAQAANYTLQLYKLRIPFSFKQDGGYATVTLLGNTTTDSGGTATSPAEVPIDNWQLLGNELQKDLYEHPKSLAMEAAKQGTLGLVRQYVNLLNQGLNATTNPDSFPASTFSNAFLATAGVQQLIGLESKGGTHYAVASPALRHTQTVSDAYNPPGSGADPFSFASSEKIYTTAQLLAECKTFPYPLPALYIKAINSIPALTATGYTWGWRKMPPSLNTVANHKIEVTVEYVSDLWNTDLVYAVAT